MLQSLVEYFRPTDRFSRLLSDTPETWHAIDAESASEQTLDTLVRLSNWGLVNLRFYFASPHLSYQASGHGEYWNLTAKEEFQRIAGADEFQSRLIAAQRTMLGNRAMGGIEPFKVNVEPRWKWEPVTWAKATAAGNVAIAAAQASSNVTVVNQPAPINFEPKIEVHIAPQVAPQNAPPPAPTANKNKGTKRRDGDSIDAKLLGYLVKHHEYDPELEAKVRNFKAIDQLAAHAELDIPKSTISTKLNNWFPMRYRESCAAKKIGFHLQSMIDEETTRHASLDDRD